MTPTLHMKARANRIVALQSLARQNGTNVISLDDARRRREPVAAADVMFISRRAA